MFYICINTNQKRCREYFLLKKENFTLTPELNSKHKITCWKQRRIWWFCVVLVRQRHMSRCDVCLHSKCTSCYTSLCDVALRRRWKVHQVEIVTLIRTYLKKYVLFVIYVTLGININLKNKIFSSRLIQILSTPRSRQNS